MSFIIYLFPWSIKYFFYNFFPIETLTESMAKKVLVWNLILTIRLTRQKCRKIIIFIFTSFRLKILLIFLCLYIHAPCTCALVHWLVHTHNMHTQEIKKFCFISTKNQIIGWFLTTKRDSLHDDFYSIFSSLLLFFG